MGIFTKKELKYIILTALVVAFAFAFDDKQPTFQLSFWLLNFLKISLIVVIAALIHILAQKITAYKYKAIAEYKIWEIRQILFWTAGKFPIKLEFGPFKITLSGLPAGIIISLLVAFLSLGKIFFITVSSFAVTSISPHRIGIHRFKNVTELEEGIIAASGPIANLFFAFILHAINQDLFAQAVFINLMFAIFSMIPISTLDGAKMFFGSLMLYFIVLIFIILSIIFINLIPIGLTIFLGILIAAVASIFIYMAFRFTPY